MFLEYLSLSHIYNSFQNQIVLILLLTTVLFRTILDRESQVKKVATLLTRHEVLTLICPLASGTYPNSAFLTLFMPTSQWHLPKSTQWPKACNLAAYLPIALNQILHSCRSSELNGYQIYCNVMQKRKRMAKSSCMVKSIFYFLQVVTLDQVSVITHQ